MVLEKNITLQDMGVDCNDELLGLHLEDDIPFLYFDAWYGEQPKTTLELKQWFVNNFELRKDSDLYNYYRGK